MAVVGSAEVNVRPLTADFAAQLQRDIDAVIARVTTRINSQLGQAFSQAGRTSATSFSTGFTSGTANFTQRASGLFIPAGNAIVASAEKTGKEAGDRLGRGAFTAFGAFFLGARLAQFTRNSVEAATSFEQAFAQAKRTLGGTEEQLSRLSTNIRQLSREIPIPAADLAQIAAAAGQLGVSITGVEAFTRTVAILGETTNLGTEAAGEFLARFANIARVPEDQFSNIASAILFIGTNTKASEREIANFSLRIAGAATAVGIAAPAIIGIGAAFASAGISAEAGGTAVQRFLIQMQRSVDTGGPALEKFARTARTSSAEFETLFRTDPTEAFIRVIEGLSAAGQDAFGVLRELGLTDARLIRAFVSTASATDTVRDAVDRTTDAYRANLEIGRQAAIIFETDAAKLQVLGQRFDEVRRNIGQVILEGFLPLGESFTNLPVGIQTTIVSVGAFLAALTVGIIIIARVNTALKALDISLSLTSLRAGAAGLSLRGLGAAGAAIAVVEGLTIGVDKLNQALERTPNEVNTLIHNLRTATPGTEAFSKAIEQLPGDISFFNKSMLDGGKGLSVLQKSFEQIDQQLANLVRTGSAQDATNFVANLTQSLKAQGVTTKDVLSVLDEYAKSVGEAGAATNKAGQAAAGSAGSISSLGIGADVTADQLAGITTAANASAAALQLLNQVSAQFDQRLATLTPRVGTTFRPDVAGGAAGAAASNTRARRDALEALTRAEEDGARRILEARRRLTRETQDGSRREADARRDVADAEEEATQRTIDALNRLADHRFQSARTFADAQQSLLDLQADLALTGGPQTTEDQRRLRDAEQAASRARENAIRGEQEGEANLIRVQEENAQRIADARRKEADATRESAEQIADARRNLADAQRESAEKIADAHQRIADAADKAAARIGGAAKAIEITLSSLAASFRTNTADLNLSVSSLGTIQSKLKALASDVAEPFLAHLLELGPEFAGQIAKLATESPKALAGLAQGFGEQIQAAKRRADIEFDKFPQNFRLRTNAATRASLKEMESFVARFNEAADSSKFTVAESISEALQTGIAKFHELATEAGVALKPVQLELIDKISNPATDALVRIQSLKELLLTLRGKVSLDTTVAERDLRKFLIRVEKEGELVFGIPRKPGAGGHTEFGSGVQHGGVIPFSGFFPTGEAGRELAFLPKGTNVFTHLQSEQFLNQLRALGSGGGTRTINQTVIAQEVAGDPEATARMIAFRLGQDAIR